MDPASEPPEDQRPAGGAEPPRSGDGGGRRIALNTAIFSIATGFSRVAGLVREIVAARYFGTTGAASAFTLAFQVPNLVRSLFADAALSAAFVPVFSELLEKDKRREAFNLAGAMFGLILSVLGRLTLVFIALAGVIIPLFTGEFTQELEDLAVGLSRVLFPILVLLGLNGLLVGILNAYDQFTIPALSPLVWNLVIIVGMVALRPLFEGAERALRVRDRRAGGHARAVRDGDPAAAQDRLRPQDLGSTARDPRVTEILMLMLPVAIGLGLINFDL